MIIAFAQSQIVLCFGIANLLLPREPEKQITLLLSITLPNVDRFLKFFHQQTQQ